MNNKVNTFTILKALIKRPITVLKNILVKLSKITSKGVLGFVFKLIKIFIIAFAVLAAFFHFVFGLDLSSFLNASYIGYLRLLGASKNLINKIVDFLSMSGDSPSAPTSTPKVLPISKPETPKVDWDALAKAMEKLKDLPPRQAEELREGLSTGKYTLDDIVKVSKPQVWSDVIKDHPYFSVSLVATAILLTAIYTQSDGSLLSMGQIVGGALSSAGAFIMSYMPSWGKVQVNTTHESVETESNKTTTTSIMSDDDKLRYLTISKHNLSTLVNAQEQALKLLPVDSDEHEKQQIIFNSYKSELDTVTSNYNDLKEKIQSQKGLISRFTDAVNNSLNTLKDKWDNRYPDNSGTIFDADEEEIRLNDLRSELNSVHPSVQESTNAWREETMREETMKIIIKYIYLCNFKMLK
jgi:hypothetical protein